MPALWSRREQVKHLCTAVNYDLHKHPYSLTTSFNFKLTYKHNTSRCNDNLKTDWLLLYWIQLKCTHGMTGIISTSSVASWLCRQLATESDSLRSNSLWVVSVCRLFASAIKVCVWQLPSERSATDTAEATAARLVHTARNQPQVNSERRRAGQVSTAVSVPRWVGACSATYSRVLYVQGRIHLPNKKAYIHKHIQDEVSLRYDG